MLTSAISCTLAPETNSTNTQWEVQSSSPPKFEKDIRVLIQPNLRPNLQCAKAAKTANAVRGQISCAVTYRDKETFIKLFRTRQTRGFMNMRAPTGREGNET